MNVLIACEYSATVREAFTALGHNAWSVDLLPTEIHGNHFQGDALEFMRSRDWDLMIGHPPCTYLSSSGLHWNGRVPGRAEKTEEALDFFMSMMNARIEKICLENPIGCISSRYRKPDQIVQPYQFGHDASKATCLWLKNLPILTLDPALYVENHWGCCGLRNTAGAYGCPNCLGQKRGKSIWSNQTPGGQNKMGPSEHRAKERAKTYQGIADAMAAQWGGQA